MSYKYVCSTSGFCYSHDLCTLSQEFIVLPEEQMRTRIQRMELCGRLQSSRNTKGTDWTILGSICTSPVQLVPCKYMQIQQSCGKCYYSQERNPSCLGSTYMYIVLWRVGTAKRGTGGSQLMHVINIVVLYASCTYIPACMSLLLRVYGSYQGCQVDESGCLHNHPNHRLGSKQNHTLVHLTEFINPINGRFPTFNGILSTSSTDALVCPNIFVHVNIWVSTYTTLHYELPIGNKTSCLKMYRYKDASGQPQTR